MSEMEAKRAGLLAPWPQWETDDLVSAEDVVQRIKDVTDAAIAAGQPHAAWATAVGAGNWEYLGQRRTAIMEAARAVLDRIEGEDDRSRRWG